MFREKAAKLSEENKSLKQLDDEIYPGQVIPFKKVSNTASVPLDEGEIEEVLTIYDDKNKSNKSNEMDDFIRINCDKGEPVLLTVSNLSNQSIKVILILGSFFLKWIFVFY